MIYRLALILTLLLTTSPAFALKLGAMVASSTTYAPSAPVSVSGAAGSGQVTVTWSAGTVDGTHSAATSYNLYRSTSAGTETLWQTGVTSPYVDTASNGTNYYYKVQAVNSAGSTLSAEAGPYTPTATVYAPNIPVIGTATAGNAQATVAFTASVVDGTHSAATSYTATSSPGGLTATGASSPLTVTGLSNGTSYTFTVTATNTAGTSAASGASNSVTPSAGSTGTEDFTGTGVYAGTMMNVYESSSGKAELDGAGTLYINLATDADDAFVTYKTPLTLAATHTYKRLFMIPTTAANNTSAYQFLLALSQAASVPTGVGLNYVANLNVSLSGGSPMVRTSGYDNTNTFHEISTTGWTGGATNTATLGKDTWYSAHFETTATQWRFMVYLPDDTTAIYTGPWINWSATLAPTQNVYLGWGDIFAGAHHGATKTDSFIVN